MFLPGTQNRSATGAKVVRHHPSELPEVVENAPSPAGSLGVRVVDCRSESGETAVSDKRHGVANVAAGRVGLVDDGRWVGGVGGTAVGRKRTERRSNVVCHGAR